MSYTDFAYIYDRLMKPDINYGEWADYIENIFAYYDKNVTLAADLACGTGNLTIPLAERGYSMTGVDISEDMLTVARDKAYEKGLSDILFLRQSITDLDLYGTMDAFLCMIDGINYVLSPQALCDGMTKLHRCFLERDGIFIFDISTRHKLRDTIGGNTFVYNDKEVFYTWQNRYIHSKHLSDMYLNFFVRNENGLYERFEERHLQRAYSQKEIEYIMKKAGFESVDVFRPLTFEKPSGDEDRIVFVAYGGVK